MKNGVSVAETERILQAHIVDLAERSERDCTMYTSRFLDERQQYLAQQWVSRYAVSHQVLFWGGYETAQRRLCCMAPSWMTQEDMMQQMPLVCLTFRYREQDALTHRDFLGAFMSCGIRRETVGDIVTGKGITQAIALQTVAPLLSGLEKIGRCGVKVTELEPFGMPSGQHFKEISATVASMRLDAIASAAIRESREKTVRLIQQGRVLLNYLETTASSAVVAEGDIITVHGSGKFRVKSVTGLSKKGRLHILIEQYN